MPIRKKSYLLHNHVLCHVTCLPGLTVNIQVSVIRPTLFDAAHSTERTLSASLVASSKMQLTVVVEFVVSRRQSTRYSSSG